MAAEAQFQEVLNALHTLKLKKGWTRATDWAFERIREAFEKVAKDKAGGLNIVQGINAPAGGQGGVTMSYLCPNCNSFPLEDYMWLQLVVRNLWRKI